MNDLAATAHHDVAKIGETLHNAGSEKAYERLQQSVHSSRNLSDGDRQQYIQSLTKELVDSNVLPSLSVEYLKDKSSQIDREPGKPDGVITKKELDDRIKHFDQLAKLSTELKQAKTDGDEINVSPAAGNISLDAAFLKDASAKYNEIKGASKDSKDGITADDLQVMRQKDAIKQAVRDGVSALATDKELFDQLAGTDGKITKKEVRDLAAKIEASMLPGSSQEALALNKDEKLAVLSLAKNWESGEMKRFTDDGGLFGKAGVTRESIKDGFGSQEKMDKETHDRIQYRDDKRHDQERTISEWKKQYEALQEAGAKARALEPKPQPPAETAEEKAKREQRNRQYLDGSHRDFQLKFEH